MSKILNTGKHRSPSFRGVGGGRFRWLAILMGITILGITGFQLYWLRQSYDREKKTLGIKTEVAFRETILHLQASKLKLDGFITDTADRGRIKIFIGDGEQAKVRFTPKEEIVSTINVIRDKLKDSLNQEIRAGMIISLNKTSPGLIHDTMRFIQKDSFSHNSRILPGADHIFNMLYGVDSLQDSLKVKEINKAYEKELFNQKLNIPFTVLRLDSASTGEEPVLDEVTVGFINPITYQLKLGNTFPYLLKRISAPILFSVFLLGITVLSFVLLYRNLLKQRRLAELKNEFISNITHELKTPIATVGVAIEALKNFNALQDPQRTKEYLDIYSNELQRLNLLVDKVLKLSMFEKKEIELKYETLDLRELVDEVVASMRLQLEKYNARISVTQNGETTIQGDRLHLLSVVFNLLDNALKYSKGDPSIEVALNGDEKNAEMSVKDNGIGIAAVYQEKVFEKFFRVPAGDTHNAKGYGLGLSYVAHVIQKHKGTIDLESQPGIGTKFIIKLPKNNLTVEK